jgi:hypothetical protein
MPAHISRHGWPGDHRAATAILVESSLAGIVERQSLIIVHINDTDRERDGRSHGANVERVA